MKISLNRFYGIKKWLISSCFPKNCSVLGDRWHIHMKIIQNHKVKGAASYN